MLYIYKATYVISQNRDFIQTFHKAIKNMFSLTQFTDFYICLFIIFDDATDVNATVIY